jgi:hypothetical protein
MMRFDIQPPHDTGTVRCFWINRLW